MSEIVIAGNTSGSVTIAAPDVAGTTTLTLPASSSTLATTADVAASTPAALSTASGLAPSYSARAWVNFNGTGTVAIRASGNVTSITDNGTGDYTVNFTTAMPDKNYVMCGSDQHSGAAGHVILQKGGTPQLYALTSSMRIVSSYNPAGNFPEDGSNITVVFFR